MNTADGKATAAAVVKHWSKPLSETVDDVPVYEDVAALIHQRATANGQCELTFVNRLREFYSALVKALKEYGDFEEPAAPWSQVPPPLSGRPVEGHLRIWQISFRAEACVRGCSPTCDIIAVLQKVFVDELGLNTQQFRLEVIFGRMSSNCSTAGSIIADMSVGLSVGSATLMGAYLSICAAMELDLLDLWAFNEADAAHVRTSKKTALEKLLSCFCLEVSFLEDADEEARAFRSIRTKIASSNRQRPNALQMFCCLDPIAKAHESRGIKKSGYRDCLRDQITQFNKKAVSGESINTDETKAMLFLSYQSARFHKILKGVWASEKLQHSAVPCAMLSEPFLDPWGTLPVTQKDNPAWYAILTPSQIKFEYWLLRTSGRFNKNVQDTINKGKAPNLRNFAHHYRDKKELAEVAWRASCLFVDSLPRATELMTGQQITELKKNFALGRLDVDLTGKATVMDPTFHMDELRYIRDEMALRDPTGCSESEESLLAATQKALRAQLLSSLGLMKTRLLGEQSAWATFRTSLSVWKDEHQVILTKYREAAHSALEGAVDAHVSSHYVTQCFERVDSFEMFFESQTQSQDVRTSLADIYRVNILNFSVGVSAGHGRTRRGVKPSSGFFRFPDVRAFTKFTAVRPWAPSTPCTSPAWCARWPRPSTPFR